MPLRSSKKAICLEIAPLAGKCHCETEAEVLGAAAFAMLKLCVFTFCHKPLGAPAPARAAQLLALPRYLFSHFTGFGCAFRQLH